MDIIERLINIVGPIFLVVAIGYFYALKRRPDLEHANKLNIEIFTPILIFSVLSQGEMHLASYLDLTLAAVLVVLLPGLLSLPVARYFGYEWKTFLPPMMFRNSGNLGLPLFVLAFGEQALAAAVILFIVENTLHFSVGMRMLKPEASLMQLIRMPMLQATCLGLLFAGFNVTVAEPIAVGLELIGGIAIPLMLFSLGVRLRDADTSSWKIGVLSGIWAPLSGLLVAGLVLFFFDLPEQQKTMLLIFAALPPAVLNFLIAEQLNQEPKQVASIVLIGNAISIFTMPLVLAFLL